MDTPLTFSSDTRAPHTANTREVAALRGACFAYVSDTSHRCVIAPDLAQHVLFEPRVASHSFVPSQLLVCVSSPRVVPTQEYSLAQSSRDVDGHVTVHSGRMCVSQNDLRKTATIESYCGCLFALDAFCRLRDAVLVMMSFHIFHVSFVSHANGKKLSSPMDRHTVRR